MALALKGTLNRKALHALSKNVLNQKDTAVFSSSSFFSFFFFFLPCQFMVLFRKHGHESCHFAVCWTDEERPVYVTSICYIMSWPFFLFFVSKEWTNMATPQAAPIWSEFFFTKCCISIDSTTIMKPANGNGATFATFVGQLSRLLGACFKIGSSVLFQWLWWTMSPDKVVLVIVGNSATT